jgi:hypothetical protein
MDVVLSLSLMIGGTGNSTVKRRQTIIRGRLNGGMDEMLADCVADHVRTISQWMRDRDRDRDRDREHGNHWENRRNHELRIYRNIPIFIQCTKVILR